MSNPFAVIPSATRDLKVSNQPSRFLALDETTARARNDGVMNVIARSKRSARRGNLIAFARGCFIHQIATLAFGSLANAKSFLKAA
jgi:hypothetical protein